MKKVVAVSVVVLSAALGLAQTGSAYRPAPGATPVLPTPSSTAPSLDTVLLEIQHATQSANVDITQLKIDRWRVDPTGKADLQHIADSLHKNITSAVPDLISDVRTSHGSVSSTFKLYHNINVVFEYLSQLTDAAGNLGKKEEYDPLNSDAAALDKARQHLSTYIEQAASGLESKLRSAAVAAATPAPTPQATPKKIVVDDDVPSKKPATTKKKRTSTPTPTPSSTPH